MMIRSSRFLLLATVSVGVSCVDAFATVRYGQIDSLQRRPRPFQAVGGLGRTRQLVLYAGSPEERETDASVNAQNSRSSLEKRLSLFTILTPIWTVVAAILATFKASKCSLTLGSLPVMQKAYVTLMFVMGLTITPKDIRRTLSNPSILSANALLCFGLMPLLACVIAKVLAYSSSQRIGLVLLGSVSGGQASNLFTLIAGGDVALSVICTLSTTLLGVISTPLLVKYLLGCAIDVDGRGILESIVSMVLVPLLTGSGLARLFPIVTKKASPFLPTIGVLSTLILVAGGSSNSVVRSSALASGAVGMNIYTTWAYLLLPSCLLSLIGGAIALSITNGLGFQEDTKRALVIETLSKSPTLAYVLAQKHFDAAAAHIPAAAMVTLAVVGALVASLWSAIGKPLGDEKAYA